MVNNKGNITPRLIYKRLNILEKESNVTHLKLKLILLHTYILKELLATSVEMVDHTNCRKHPALTQDNFRFGFSASGARIS